MNFHQKILKRFRKNRDGAASIEFAILALPLLMTIFASIEVGYKAIVQAELDSTLFRTAGDIAILSFDEDTAEKFVRAHICGTEMTTFLKCDDIQIGVKVVPTNNRLINFRDVSIIGEWELGCAYDALLIEFNYPVLDIVHPITTGEIIKREGVKYYRSRGITRREPLVSGPGSC